MRTRVGNRLPTFSRAEAALVKGSVDLVGINHYTTYYAKKNSTDIVGILLRDTLADSGAITLPFKDGTGNQKLDELYIKHKYGNPPVFITENGMDNSNNPFTSLKDALKDEKRIKYHNDYLSSLLASIKDKLKRYPKHSVQWFTNFLTSTT